MDFDFATETITPDNTTLLTIGGTGAIEVPLGNTANRPTSPTNGALRYNTDITDIEGYINSAWVPLSTTTSSVTTFSAGTTGFTPNTATSGPVTLAGTLNIANGGTGLSTAPTNGQIDIGSTGVGFVRTTIASGTAISVVNGAGSITIVNTGVTSNVAGTGISVSGATGAVTITNTGVTSAVAGTGISVSGATGAVTFTNTGVTSFSAGTTGLTPNTATTGVVSLSGILVPSNGGTGIATTPANGQLLVGNGTNYTVATVGAGTGISTTVGAGSLQINNTGVTSLAGTAGNITASAATGSVTLNLASITQGSGSNFVKVSLDGFGRVTGNTAVAQGDLTGLLGTYYLPTAGGTMTGAINMGTNQINNLGMSGTPAGTDAVNVNYVQSQITGLSWKQAVKAATTANLTATYANGTAGLGATLTNSGTQVALTLDGVTLLVGDRVLVKNQSTIAQNGIYSVTTVGSGSTNWVLTRTTDANSGAELDGAAVYVDQGTVYADTGWTQTFTVVVIGTDSIVWAQFTGSGTYTAGTGLTLTGNTFSLTSPVIPSLGGTGTSAIPIPGQILIGTSGNIYAPATLTQGTGITITSASGSITVANAGVTSFSAGTTGFTPNTATTGAVTLAGTLVTANGGTGVTTTPLNGQILVGNGTNYTVATLATGTGISTTVGAGSLQINNTGVTSAIGTAGNITVSAATGAVTFNLATAGTAGTYGTVTTDAFGRVTSGVAINTIATGGTGLGTLGTANQILGVNAGATGLEYKTVTAGTAISVVNAAGSLTINNTGVTSLAGTANQITASAATGAVTLSLPNAVTFPGSATVTTNLTVSGLTANSFLYSGVAGLLTTTTAPTNGQLLIGSTGSAPVAATLTAGTGMSITNAAGSITLNNTGVTSVGLSLPGIFSVSGTPVTTTGTLTATLASQSANTVFAAPNGSAGTPTFRTLAYADLPLKLYVENPSSPTAPTAAGTNALALGSGSAASSTGSFAVGNGALVPTTLFGARAFANGSIASAGDSQAIDAVMRNITTNNTATELFLDTGTTARMVLPNNSAWTAIVKIVARRTDGTGVIGSWTFQTLIYRDATAATTTMVGTSKTTIARVGLVAGNDPVLSADTTNGSLKITVVGNNSQTIRWVASVELVQVTN